jgi:pimeloyl-ACP methyl ester carboxylesterase
MDPLLARAWLRRIPWCLAAFVLGCGGAQSERAEGAPAPSAPSGEERDANADTAAAAAVATTRSRALLGGALHALEAGPTDAPVVLLLHGARFSARTWDELGTLARLADAGWHALALDWPGYGSTPRWDGEPDAAVLLERVCDELAAERVVLLAASMGGRFAFEFSSQHPARVAALVAVAPAGAENVDPAVAWPPTLLVWGERDDVIPPETAGVLAERLGGARLEILPGAGHPCYIDRPERFHAVLLEFLAARAHPDR